MLLPSESSELVSAEKVTHREEASSGDALVPIERVQKLDTLTSLRFFAALLILVHHLRGRFGIPGTFLSPLALDNGVSFFFVLSGFILTYVYASQANLSRRRFLLARFARVWPAHIFALILLVCLFPRVLQYNFSITKLLANVTMVQSWIPLRSYNDSFVGASWSISTEFGFYLLFLLLVSRWEQTWHLKLLISLLLVIVIILATNAFLPSIRPGIRPDVQRSLVYIHPLGRLFEFTLGMATAELWRKCRYRFNFGRRVGTLLEVAILSLVAFTLWNALDYAGRLYPIVGGAGSEWFAHGGVACLPAALLIFVFAFQRGFLSRCLAWTPLVLLGEISYSFYLVHQTFIEYVRRNSQAFAIIPGWLLVSLLLTTIFLTSYLAWALVERPSRAFLVGLWPAGSKAMSTRAITGSLIAADRLGDAVAGLRVSLPSAAAALALFVIAGVAVWLVNFRSSLSIISATELESIAASTSPEIKSVTFGNRFLLAGYRWQTQSENQIQLELAWQSLQSQDLEFLTALHLVDQQGNICSQADCEQDSTHSRVASQTAWRQVVTLSPERLGNATHIAIGLLKGKDWLLANRGPTDWGNRRLLVPLPPKVKNFNQSAKAENVGPIFGFLETVNSNSIGGWAWNSKAPEQRLSMDVFDADRHLATVAATNFRADLLKGKIGDGCYSFRIATPAELKDGKLHQVHVRVSATGQELKNSPKTIGPAK